MGIDVRNLDYRALEEGGQSFRDVFLSFSRQTSSGRIVAERQPVWSECKIPIPGRPLPITVYQVRIEVEVARQEGRPDPGFAVKVTPNKETFTDGERMQLEITATRPCHVTVLNITAADTAVVILPHEHRPASYVGPGDTLRVPDEDEKAMGISYPVTVPEGRRQAAERILVIATRTERPLGAGWRRTGHHNQVGTRKAALVHLMRWLVQVPREEWAEDHVAYYGEGEGRALTTGGVMYRYCVVYLVGHCSLLFPLEADAVKEAVKDVRFRTHGDKVHIYYTPWKARGSSWSTKCPYWLSDDGGRTFSIVPNSDSLRMLHEKSLSGAVGKGVRARTRQAGHLGCVAGLSETGRERLSYSK